MSSGCVFNAPVCVSVTRRHLRHCSQQDREPPRPSAPSAAPSAGSLETWGIATLRHLSVLAWSPRLQQLLSEIIPETQALKKQTAPIAWYARRCHSKGAFAFEQEAENLTGSSSVLVYFHVNPETARGLLTASPPETPRVTRRILVFALSVSGDVEIT